ncbi:hypothetical protein [Streptomyces sp. t39]|uniref:hypothetical protein n=1 Tax=Streptomyces sp. t39 TaxID=1828156 RepID=UPI0011CE57C4|nr:hypothetical protein [Streptomyces sp. t39]TXS39662.1 hypothetical protein EAO77_36265 [Streptomyces sp. t39]
MAIENLAPDPDDAATTGRQDSTAIDSCLALLRRTGQPIPKSTLIRRLKAAGVPVVLVNGRAYVSWSLVLPVHRDWVEQREQRKRR